MDKSMFRQALSLLIVVFLTVCTSATVLAGDTIVISDFASGADAKGIPLGWDLKERSGTADFGVVKDGALYALRLRSNDTSFSFQRPVKVDIRQYPVLAWKWKVTKLPQGGDFRKSQTDDQAAQVFLAFTRTKAIVYIWDTSAPQGLMLNATAPPFMTIKAVVVRSGERDLGKWVTERRNVYEDYKKLFNAEPPAVTGVRLQINSQHTGTSAESYFADVKFTKE
jgi:hypothetical protein